MGIHVKENFVDGKYATISNIAQAEIIEGTALHYNIADNWVYNDAEKLVKDLLDSEWNGSNLLIMTSGNFDGQDMDALAKSIIKQEDQDHPPDWLIFNEYF